MHYAKLRLFFFGSPGHSVLVLYLQGRSYLYAHTHVVAALQFVLQFIFG